VNARRIAVVYGKELRDTLRDRRTLFTVFVLPTVVMPLIVLAFGFAAGRVVGKARAEVAEIMLVGGETAPGLRAALEEADGLSVVPPADDYRARISDKRLRAAIEVPAGFEAALAEGGDAVVRVYHHEGDLKSGFAVAEIEGVLRAYRERIVAARLADRGLSPSLIAPFAFARENVAPPERVGGGLVGGFIPYVVILLCFTGAMYPAMDLTAGEKERGTLEPLLCTPVPRIDLVLGKFLMVLTGSLATVLLAGLSAAATLPLGAWLLAGGAPAGGAAGPGGVAMTVDPLGLLASLVLVLPVAVLFAAALFALALPARSQKEAQSLISPLVVVVILPALGALLPGVELTPALAFVPILNVALASKDLVSGVFDWSSLALIFLSTSAYAAAALAAAVKMFGRESVFFRV
jgi:sodium transport system permease protein